MPYDRRTWDGALSGAALGAGEPPPDEGDLLPVDTDRFEDGGLLGAGGMGEVRLARDRVLRRDVAVKMPRSSDLGAARQLLHEARLTARLEHPGVVPVHLAGMTPEGRPYYAMRLLRGQTLSDAMAAARELPERLALVRRVLDVAHAVSFAHDQGVVHRDIKPSNVMVGGYGETVVTDWGLAVDLTAPAPEGGHATAGTPGYMAPEQQAGGSLDLRSDVYSVGAMLHELVHGSLPAGPEEPTAPPELAAIIRRATCVELDGRYPDMASLAADLEAWFQGRRVSAHVYSPRELLVRVVRAWRAPLAVAGLAVVALVAAITTGWRNTRVERDRAVEAEHEAEGSLGLALAAQARIAAAADQRAEAEILAAHALRLGPSPVARGVLSRFGGRARPQLVGRVAIPGCLQRSVSDDERSLACRTRDAVLLLDLDTEAREVGRLAMSTHAAVFASDPGRLLIAALDGSMLVWEPPEAPRALVHGPMSLPFVYARKEGAAWLRGGEAGRVGEDGALWLGRACGASPPSAVAAVAGDGVVMACQTGDVFLERRGEAPRWVYRYAGLEGAPSSVAMDPEASLAAVGLPRGEVVIVDVASGVERMRLRSDASAVRRMTLYRQRLALYTDSGRVEVFDLDSRASLLRLLTDDAWIGWTDDGDLIVVDEAVERWRLGAVPRRHTFTTSGGVSAVHVATSELVAAGLGTGSVVLIHPDEREPRREIRWQDNPIKDVAFDPSSGRLAASATMEDSFRVFEADTNGAGRVIPSGAAVRRMVWTPDGRLFTARFSTSAVAWSADLSDGSHRFSDSSLGDLEAIGAHVVGVADDGGVWSEDGDDAWHARLATTPTSGAPYRGEALVGMQGYVAWIDRTGAERQRWAVGGDVTDLQVSGDGTLLAVGLLQGGIRVLRLPDGEPLAQLDGHSNRVVSLAFSLDDRWLVSGSWDQTVRWWSTAELTEDPEALVERLTAAWGRSLEAVLGAGR